jgi:hypothetical protein
MAAFRELDNRKMRDRDVSSGDRGNGGDMDTLTSGTTVPTGMSGTEGYGDQNTGMGTGYSSGGQMAGSGQNGGGADAGDNSNMGVSDRYSRGEPLPDSGGPDVSDMGENEPNTGYGKSSDVGGDGDPSIGRSGRATDMGNSGGLMGDSRAGDDSGTSGVGMGTSSGGSSALDMGSSTGSGGNWGDPGASLGGGLSNNTTTSGQN